MSKYVDLISLLTEEDKTKIQNFICNYGINKEHFIGLEKWLQNWSHSNQKLYKLLGNQFIKSIDFTYNKTESELRSEVWHWLDSSKFKESYHNFYHNIIIPLYADDKINDDARAGFNHITDVSTFVNDTIFYPFKIKLEGKKCLQIPANMKPMRAFQKIITYFKDEFNFEGFEEFRLKHSVILNDKVIKGRMCFSIHPLDFLTMSDNDNNWTSCMSWTDEGCYHIGTVEMMNSNNVLCCYIENEKNPYIFAKNDDQRKEGDSFVWNNKLWRNLVYVTKDIIMAGKAYPYRRDELSISLIKYVVEFAKENLGWTYQFGPEKYQDMQYINTSYSMNRAKDYMHMSPRKHNIMWDTRGMYNDMLNDHHSTTYWCYRNKVNHNKVISVSGKAPCLCCGDSVIEYNDYDGCYDYNERYTNTGNVICNSCLNNFICVSCQSSTIKQNAYHISVNGYDMCICENCFKKKVRICPDCGQIMYIKSALFYYGNIDRIKEAKNRGSYIHVYLEESYNGPYSYKKLEEDEYMGGYVCKDCAKKLEPYIEKVAIPQYFGRDRRMPFINNMNINPSKYFWENLEEVAIPDPGKTINVVESYSSLL